MTDDMEQHLRRAAERFAYPAEMPADLMQKVRRRRSRRAGIATAATAAVVAVVVAVPVALTRPNSSSSGNPRPAEPPAAAASTPNAPGNSFPALPVPSTPAGTSTPASFYAEVGAGAERLGVVGTTTGTVQRYLQSTGSQALMIFSWDRHLAWQGEFQGCGQTWSQIDLATGRETAAFTDLPDPREIAVSPTGQRIAYVYYGAQRMVRVRTATGTTMQPAGCPTAPVTLAVTDTATGATRRWPLSHNDGHALYLAFDPTATHLAFVDSKGRIRVLDINSDATPDQARPLTSADPNCSQTKPAYRPDSDQVLVVEMCPSSTAIVGYRASDGTLAYTHRTPTIGLVAAYAVDRSGKHLIYSLDPRDNSGNGVVYVARDEGGADLRVADDIFGLAW